MSKLGRSVQRHFDYGAKPIIYENAKRLRRKMTRPESILWQKLRGKKFDTLKFRRQHPVDQFIADFYCHKLQLIVEVDGSIHNLHEIIETDNGRTHMLKSMGIAIIRFSNEDIINNLESVLTVLRIYCQSIQDKNNNNILGS
jgi:imidazole glycerol-phosphate synthase subunit HisF